MARKPTYEELEKSLKQLRGEMLKREHVEKKLLVVKGRLQHLLTSSTAVIYTCVPGGDYEATFISENVKGQLGYKPQEFVNDPMFWANHIHPEDRARVFDGLSQLFEKRWHSHEYRFQHNDGTYRWMRDELQLVLDGEDHPVEIVGYWIGIDDRKQADQELQNANRQLMENNKALATLAKNIERTKNDVEANIEKKIRFSIVPVIEGLQQSKNLSRNHQRDLKLLLDLVADLTSTLNVQQELSATFTPTEFRVTVLIGEGLITNEIARHMHISPETVKSHRKNIRKKLNLNNTHHNLRAHLQAALDR